MEVIGILILLALIYIALALMNIHRTLEEFVNKNQFNHNRLFEGNVNSSVGLGNIMDDIRKKINPKPWEKFNEPE
ncbi:hypothetical protein [Methylotenera sp.]|uniref:hypothetical protein n=1 Tax=Methylotenera sp. TaxID=2051956 RepID=UPI002488B7CC|nr:hypothetical protein [Methylotenera sp.]MDI1299481.1 hypothetical protein [Methylotenera sp.]